MDRYYATIQLQWWQRPAWQNFEAGQQAVTDTAHRWGHIGAEAGAARITPTFVGHSDADTSPLQGGGCRAGESHGANDLGASGQGRHLPSTGKHGEGIENKGFQRLGAGIYWQGAKA